MTTPDPASNPYPIGVHVTVDIHGKPTCTCDPPTAGPTTPGVTLAFTILTTPWVFDDRTPTVPIVITTADPTGQFPNPPVVTSPTTATLYDVNSDTVGYLYKVNVYNPTNGDSLDHDPMIKNGGATTCDD